MFVFRNAFIYVSNYDACAYVYRHAFVFMCMCLQASRAFPKRKYLQQQLQQSFGFNCCWVPTYWLFNLTPYPLFGYSILRLWNLKPNLDHPKKGPSMNLQVSVVWMLPTLRLNERALKNPYMDVADLCMLDPRSPSTQYLRSLAPKIILGCNSEPEASNIGPVERHQGKRQSKSWWPFCILQNVTRVQLKALYELESKLLQKAS